MNPEISVLLPMYNEESVLSETLSVVRAELLKVTDSFELLCINDGSTDRTAELLNAAAQQDVRLRPIELSRNFGKEAAMAAGLDHARGRAVLLLDADLQHPATLIPEMVAAWRAGAEVVNGVEIIARARRTTLQSHGGAVQSINGRPFGGFSGSKRLQVTRQASGGRAQAMPRKAPLLSRLGGLGGVFLSGHSLSCAGASRW